MENNDSFAILLVEDDVYMRHILKTILVSMGFTSAQILEAGNGEEALQKLEKVTKGSISGIGYIKLIISDNMMPKMTGIELLQQVKSNQLWQTIPFLMLTSVNDEVSVVDAIDIGVSNYLVKPCSPELFENAVMDLLKSE